MSKPFISIVGAGPAGLSAAIFAASEGFDVTVYDKAKEVGGQMRCSTWIENYPGYSDGITGDTLAELMREQAEDFGAYFALGTEIADLTNFAGTDPIIVATGRSSVEDPALPASDHVCYMLPSDKFTNLVDDKRVLVVGGGNGGCQAAFKLHEMGAESTMVTSGTLGDNCSQFMVDKIHRCAVSNSTCDFRLHERSRVVLSKEVDNYVQVVIEDKFGIWWVKTFDLVLVYRASKPNVPPGFDATRMEIAGDAFPFAISRIAWAVGDGSRAVSVIQERMKGKT